MSLRKITSSMLLMGAAVTLAPGTHQLAFSPIHCAYGQSLQSVEDQYTDAADLYAQGQWAASAEAFEALMKDHAGTRQASGARFFLGEAWVQQNEFTKALPAYKQFVLENPRHEFIPRATFRLGESAMHAGQTNEALRTFEHFVQTWPKHDLVEFALPYLGTLRLDRGEPQLAKATFEMALKLFPNTDYARRNRLGLAKSFQRMGNASQAKLNYQFVIDTAESEELQQDSALPADPLVGDAHLQMGIIAFEQDDFSSAAKQLSVALRQCAGADRVTAVYWLARTEMALDNNAAAVELVSALVTAMPDHPIDEAIGAIALFDGAVAATHVQRETLACLWLEKLRAYYPTNDLCDDAFRLEIDLHQKNLRPEKVIDLYAGLKPETTDPDVYQHAAELAGRAKYALGDYKESVLIFADLLTATASDDTTKLFPDEQEKRSKWHYLKGLGELGATQYEAAEESFSAAQSLAQSDELPPLIDLARATSFYAQKDFDTAAQHYQTVLLAGPKGVDAIRATCELTVCFAQLQQWDDAVDSFALMNAFEPSDLLTETTQYIADKALDDDHAAAEVFYSALTSSRHDTEIQGRGWLGLAWARMKSNQIADTQTIFESLIASDADQGLAMAAAIHRAQFLDAATNAKAAEKMYGMVIDAYPESSFAGQARLRRAHLLTQLGGKSRLKSAKSLLKEQLQWAQTDTETEAALYQLGWLLFELDETDAAAARFDRLVEQFPDGVYWPETALRVANVRIGENRVADADTLIERIIDHQHATDEIVSRGLLLSCRLAAEANDWPKVAERTNRLKTVSNSAAMNSRATYWQGESLYQQAQFEESFNLFHAVAGKDSLDSQLQPWVSLRTAQCLAKMDRWSDALQVAQEGRVQHADFEKKFEFDFMVGRALETQGRFDDAVTEYQAVIHSANGANTEAAAIAQWRIGEVEFHRENYADAIAAYAKVDAISGNDQWRKAAMLQAGKCQEHLGNWKHAATLYQQLVNRFPETDMAHQARKRMRLIERQAQKIITEKRR